MPFQISSGIAGNSWMQIAAAAAVFLCVIAGLWIYKRWILAHVQFVARTTRGSFDDAALVALDRLRFPFAAVLALYLSLQILTLPPVVVVTVRGIMLAVISFVAIQALQGMTAYFLRSTFVRFRRKDDESVVRMLLFIVKSALWSVAVLLILSNVGIEVTALIASLGIGGVAVALAVQNILGDVFNSFSIYLDRPFETGDFIIVDSSMGTVQRIGIKTTRILALGGEELVIPNSQLTASRIQNFKKLRKRRVVMNFGVEFGTPTDVLARIADDVKGIIAEMEQVEFDRSHFVGFGEHRLEFEAVYYVLSDDYNAHMNIQQRIYLQLLDRLRDRGVALGIPTRSLRLEKPVREVLSSREDAPRT